MAIKPEITRPCSLPPSAVRRDWALDLLSEKQLRGPSSTRAVQSPNEERPDRKTGLRVSGLLKDPYGRIGVIQRVHRHVGDKLSADHVGRKPAEIDS